jgi:hypothetical protein
VRWVLAVAMVVFLLLAVQFLLSVVVLGLSLFALLLHGPVLGVVVGLAFGGLMLALLMHPDSRVRIA